MPDVVDDRYFTLDELRAFKLSDRYQDTGTAVAEIAYHVLPNSGAAQKRIVEHARPLFFAESLNSPLELGEVNELALPYESYKLALTDEILSVVFQDRLTAAVHTVLTDKQITRGLSCLLAEAVRQ